jgi:hypothetical protein
MMQAFATGKGVPGLPKIPGLGGKRARQAIAAQAGLEESGAARSRTVAAGTQRTKKNQRNKKKKR